MPTQIQPQDEKDEPETKLLSRVQDGLGGVSDWKFSALLKYKVQQVVAAAHMNLEKNKRNSGWRWTQVSCIKFDSSTQIACDSPSGDFMVHPSS